MTVTLRNAPAGAVLLPKNLVAPQSSTGAVELRPYNRLYKVSAIHDLHFIDSLSSLGEGGFSHILKSVLQLPISLILSHKSAHFSGAFIFFANCVTFGRRVPFSGYKGL